MLKIAILELPLDATRAYAVPSISTVETANGEWIVVLSPGVVIDFTIGSVGFVISRIATLLLASDVITAYMLFSI